MGGDCSHFMGGNPGDRLRHAGYKNYTWAENLGCRSGNPKSAVLGSHLFFQAEKPSNGGHYVNLMNAKYDRVGIGVWVSSVGSAWSSTSTTPDRTIGLAAPGPFVGLGRPWVPR